MTSNRQPLDLTSDLRGGDEGDRANAQAEHDLAIAIRQARAHPTLRARGRCHYCEEKVEGDARFCAVDPKEPIEYSCIRAWDEEHQKNRRPARTDDPFLWAPYTEEAPEG